MSEVIEKELGFVREEEVLDLVACSVHGGGEQGVLGVGDVRGGLSAEGEAIDVRDRNGVEGEEVGVVAKMLLEVKLSFVW